MSKNIGIPEDSQLVIESKNPSQEQNIEAELKAKYGEIFVLSLPDGNTGKTVKCYLRKPTRDIVKAAYNFSGIEQNEVLLNSCWIENVSNERIKTEDDLYFSALASLGGILSIRQGELKKL